ncbi:MAG: PorP/SprF family type IX secretion system membrane protein [Bacteroidales bacterium]|nr:PorP/SprF family type IX secretion system membrane protein [Bacteroidales bacterium]MDY3101668.1 PorP/SprF family type IX secretion system membrane protein [Porphyromonas sp.]
MYENGFWQKANSLLLFRGVFLLLFAVRALPSMAQYDVVLSQYDRAITFYNPAMAGGQEELDITTLYHQQWIGIAGAPANVVLLANTQVSFLERKHGVGMALLAQKKGLFTNTALSGQYAFIQPLLGGHLAVGVELGLFNSVFDGTKVYLPDGEGITPNDPALPLMRVTGKTFDMGVGVAWRNDRMALGVSSHHLWSPRVRLNESYYLDLRRSFAFHSSYRFTSEESLFAWMPSCLVVSDLDVWRVDTQVQMEYASRFRAGLLFRWINAAGFSLGMKFGSLSLGYAFEMPITQIMKGNWGSHELAVSYLLPMKKNKNKEARHKSVRLL